MKLIIINDNVPSKGLKNDWGWSVYIKFDQKNILFDADTNPSVMAYNMSRLGLEPQSIDYAFLSHYHKDHYGGLRYIVEEAPGLKLYAPLGNSSILKDLTLDVETVLEPRKIDDRVWSSGSIYAKSRDLYEQAVGLETENGKLVVIVGCSHPGVDVLASRLREITGKEILLVIGGYHEPSLVTLENLARITKYIAPAHCSGNRAKEYVKENYPERYIEVRTGSIVTIKDDRVKVSHYQA